MRVQLHASVALGLWGKSTYRVNTVGRKPVLKTREENNCLLLSGMEPRFAGAPTTPTHLAGHLTPSLRFKLSIFFAEYVCVCVVRLSSTEQFVAYIETSRLSAYDSVKREVCIDSATINAGTMRF
jgi:hypothetical protein